ncbi:MAG: flagellar hook-length control protein FliK [Pseudorhizobium sp.]
MSILAGLSAATNNIASARSSNGGEGRKGADGNGEKSSKAASDVNGRLRDTMTSSDMLEMPVADDVASGPDRNFRFINAKNGSLNNDLTSAAQSRDRSGSEGKTGMPQTENVMVLDSRRFIGMQSSTNSASLMAAMVGDQSWSAAMQHDAGLSNIASQSSSGSVVHTLKLQMTPHDLGTVTATLKMIGDQLHVHLTVETRAAHRQLSEDSSGMLDSLRSQGFTVDQVSISIAPNAETDPQKGQQGSPTGQQQTTGNGERQSSANRNPSGERFSQMTDSRNIDDEASLDNSALAGVGGTGGAHAGQLYL